MPSEQQLSDVLSEFARTMVTEFPIQAILDHLVQRIVRAYDEHKTRVAEQQMFLLAEPRHADAASAEKQAAAAAQAEKATSVEAKG